MSQGKQFLFILDKETIKCEELAGQRKLSLGASISKES